MMRKPYKQPEHLTTIDDEEAVVRYDYSLGESEWFDACDGVGGPGEDPWVEITEVCDIDGVWKEVHGKEPWYERVEQEITDTFAEIAAAEAQAMYESYQADQEYWKQLEKR